MKIEKHLVDSGLTFLENGIKADFNVTAANWLD